MLPSENNDMISKNSKDLMKAYKRRWVILSIYILYACGNSFQWIEYSIIANTVTKYYEVSPFMVDLTSIIYMAAYPVAVVPVSYLIDTKGLRVAALYGGIGTALAALIKVFAIRRDLFYMVLLGQAVGSTAQVFIQALPTKIAAVWFKLSEVSTACALGVFGNQLGFAMGFIFPPSIVKSDDDLDSIAYNLSMLCWGLVIYMAPLILCIIFLFPKEPALPPSILQAEARKHPRMTFKEFIADFNNMFKNDGFTCHMLGYGLNYGIFSVVGTLLNQYVLQHFSHGEEDAGRMGFISVICGLIGSVLCGIILDKTHKFKATCLSLFYLIFLSLASFIVALWQQNILLSYITLSIFTFFNNSYITAGVEFAVELTYPQEESTATGILNASSQAAGVLILLVASKINERFGSLWSLTGQLVLVGLGIIFTHCVPNSKNRQNALGKDIRQMNDYVVVAKSEIA